MFDWFWEFLYRLLKTILYCIDFIMSFANKLVGVEPVYDANDQEVDLLNFFFTSETILDAFKLVALVGIVLLLLFTAFAVVRAIAKLGEGKTPAGVCVSAAKSLLYFLLIPAIMIIGGQFVSAVMTSIYRATSNGSSGLGSALFTLFGDEAYNGGGNKEQVLAAFRAGGPFTESGDYNYYDMGDVKNYFSLSKINYFLGFVAGVAVLILLVIPMISYVERIISLLLLFIVSPISVASSVLDDGVRFKLWRDQVINKFLIAYGSILSLNIFVLMVGVIYEITFFRDSSFLNGLARLLFVLGGAFACRMGTVLIGNLVNQGAGSQYAQDMHNLSGAAHRVAAPLSMLAAKGAGAIGRRLNPFGGSGSKHKNASSDQSGSSGGKGGGSSLSGSSGTSQRFTERTTKIAPGASGAGAGMGVGQPQAWKKGTVPGRGANGIQIGQKPRTMPDVLAGKPVGGNGSAIDNSMNKEGAATLKNAMKSGKGGVPTIPKP